MDVKIGETKEFPAYVILYKEGLLWRLWDRIFYRTACHCTWNLNEVINEAESILSHFKDKEGIRIYGMPDKADIGGMFDFGYNFQHKILCAEIKREEDTLNDMQALREALVNIEKLAHCDLGCVYQKYRQHFDDMIGGIERIARAALKKPPRNCDIGSVEEQLLRFRDYCLHSRKKGCGWCHNPPVNLMRCVLTWAQMPYEAPDNKEK